MVYGICINSEWYVHTASGRLAYWHIGTDISASRERCVDRQSEWYSRTSLNRPFIVARSIGPFREVVHLENIQKKGENIGYECKGCKRYMDKWGVPCEHIPSGIYKNIW